MSQVDCLLVYREELDQVQGPEGSARRGRRPTQLEVQQMLPGMN